MKGSGGRGGDARIMRTSDMTKMITKEEEIKRRSKLSNFNRMVKKKIVWDGSSLGGFHSDKILQNYFSVYLGVQNICQ